MSLSTKINPLEIQTTGPHQDVTPINSTRSHLLGPIDPSNNAPTSPALVPASAQSHPASAESSTSKSSTSLSDLSPSPFNFANASDYDRLYRIHEHLREMHSRVFEIQEKVEHQPASERRVQRTQDTVGNTRSILDTITVQLGELRERQDVAAAKGGETQNFNINAVGNIQITLNTITDQLAKLAMLHQSNAAKGDETLESVLDAFTIQIGMLDKRQDSAATQCSEAHQLSLDTLTYQLKNLRDSQDTATAHNDEAQRVTLDTLTKLSSAVKASRRTTDGDLVQKIDQLINAILTLQVSMCDLDEKNKDTAMWQRLVSRHTEEDSSKTGTTMKQQHLKRQAQRQQRRRRQMKELHEQLDHQV